MGWPARLTLAIGGLVAVGVAGLVVLTLIAPTTLVRDELIRQVKAKTGRDLIVSGTTALSFYPSVAVSMGGVTLSAPPGTGGPPTLTMKALDASLPLWPLIRREIVVDRLVLREPVIELAVDRQGRRSWDLGAVGADLVPPPRVRLAQLAPRGSGERALPPELQDFVRHASQPAAEPARARAGGLQALSLRDVRIERGTVRYSDARSGLAEEITNLDAALAMPSLASPLTAAGSASYKRERVDFDVRIQSLPALIVGQSSPVTMRLEGRPGRIALEGALGLGRTAAFEGPVSVNSPSLGDLARWLGQPLAMASPGGLALKGRLKAAGTLVALAELDASLGTDLTAKGSIAVETQGPRPTIRASLRMAELDLDRVPALAGAAPPAGGAAQPKSDAPRSIEDLLKEGDPAPRPGTRVRGFAKRTGWSETPIDLAVLGLVDVEARLSLGRLSYQEIKVGETQATVSLKGRVLRATFDDVQLYEGRGRGLLTLDATGPVATLGANISAEGISALPILRDAASFDWIAGKGRLALAIAGRGGSEREIMQTLSGKAEFAFADGAVVGINVAQILRGLGQGRISGLDRVPTEKTDFSELSATFAIEKGVARNQDLKLVSPLLRVGGGGAIDLGQRQIDYTARPRLVASLAGQGGGATLPAGLEVPLKITGSFEKPRVSADVDAVLKNPEQAMDVIKGIAKQFKGKSPEEALRSLLGNGEGSAKPRELLNQLLKQR
jgi:AsmA protein